jgi:hypothetical protein
MGGEGGEGGEAGGAGSEGGVAGGEGGVAGGGESGTSVYVSKSECVTQVVSMMSVRRKQMKGSLCGTVTAVQPGRARHCWRQDARSEGCAVGRSVAPFPW